MKKPLLNECCTMVYSIMILIMLSIPGVVLAQFSLSFDADNEICDNQKGRAWVSPNGGTSPFTYFWSNGEQSDTIENLSAGTYVVTVTDKFGLKGIDSVEVQNDIFIIQLNTTATQPLCNSSNGALSVTALAGTPPYSYNWSTGSSSTILSNLTAGVYGITVSDVNGCVLEKNVLLNDVNGPTVSLSTVSVSCFGKSDGAVSTNVTGGNPPYNYLWSNSSQSNSISNLKAGNYSLIITDNNNCKTAMDIVVNEPDKLIVDVFPLQSACGGFGGKAAVEAIGGTPPYMYNWPNGDTSNSIGGLVAGLYLCSVTDANGCEDFDVTNINTTPPPGSVLTTFTSTCSGKADGKIQLTVSAGQPPFSFQWSNGSGSQNLNNVEAGEYSVTIVDGNGCSNVNSTQLGTTKPISIEFDVSPVSAVDANDGKIEAMVTGATPPITYQWSNSSSGPINNNLTAGNYSLTVFDVEGCNKNASTGVYLVGVDDIEYEQFSIYPNPVSTQVNIEILKAEHVLISVYDEMGRLILNNEFQNSRQFQFDASELPSGFYHIQILSLSSNSRYSSRSFIKL
ncbi:MAG: T9SS type A sorting domain-containing protein [Chitinophagales bacterium]|nr:T9SS type A sorting domain-containing protein [Chitinophagales bacterium]